MNIRVFQNSDVNNVVTLFNKHCQNELVYKPWTNESFKNKFLDNKHFSYESTFVAIKDDNIIGFANGLSKKIFLPNENKENSPGYITMIIVDRENRRKGLGSKLLELVENSLKAQNKLRFDCIFFNPINLEWFIPNTNNHEHPNAPGVEYPSFAYEFFFKHNYKPVAKENSYHLNLHDFIVPEDIKKRLKNLEEKDIKIEFYDKNRHYGYEELFDKLGNEGWRNEIMNTKRDVLVPTYENKVIGFTGPLYVETSKRGYFAGIGVHPDYRAYGVGKALFFMLCSNLKNEGAEYMTLFTGEDNPARRMYEAAGFKIVKSWYVMRKELK